MHLRWLKDFVAVAEFGSFSKAADSRAITQPAMSRHIKGLEEWVGVELIDRSVFPAQLTDAGEKFLKLSSDTLDQLQNGIADLRQAHHNDAKKISLSMQHVLAAEFFSQWWSQLQIDDPGVKVVVEANNLHDCMQRLESRQCEWLLCFRHPSVPLYFDQNKFESKKVGEDIIVPVSAKSDQSNSNEPLYDLDRLDVDSHHIGNAQHQQIPLVGSGPNDFMGKIITGIIHRNKAAACFNPVYEDSFSEGVRSQALIGTGLAWLPSMLVQSDIERKRLMIVGNTHWQEPLAIHLYRRVDNEHPVLQNIWQQI
ncbi:MAG: LysR family transcriptional regulator [Gammaproteobacteria bacterium]|nr:LysR family transcriptional regulator [Gammaproteobacteria bacterium]